MTEKDITKIRIGMSAISIIGFRQVMAEMVRSHAEKSDEEIAAVMLERLGRDN